MDYILLMTAASIGIIHTAIGVDHYLPFVAMSKANNWNIPKTAFVVTVCGIGHVLGSVILGFAGILLGSRLTALVGIEEFRGELVTWLLIAFGLIYMIWGIKKAVTNKPHRHILGDGSEVWHGHGKTENTEPPDEHVHKTSNNRAFWPLFVLLVLGPCEPLIPILMYPAAHDGIGYAALTAAVFSVCTIATMLVCTMVVRKGLDMVPLKKMERYAHALAGFTVLMCGLAMQFLGI